MASELCNECIENIKTNEENKIYSIVCSSINKMIISSNCYNNIFEFLNDIFCRLLMGHPLMNGNKRLSLSFLVVSLRYFGYYFKWTSKEYKNLNYYENILKEFIKNLELKIPNYTNEILNWIIENTVLSYYGSNNFSNKNSLKEKYIDKDDLSTATNAFIALSKT